MQDDVKRSPADEGALYNDISSKERDIPWCFTVKYHGKISETNNWVDYQPYIDNMAKLGYIKYIEEEKDSKGKSHIHGVIYLRKGMLRKKLCINGFHTHLIECYNEYQWRKYITKDQLGYKPLNQIYMF